MLRPNGSLIDSGHRLRGSSSQQVLLPLAPDSTVAPCGSDGVLLATQSRCPQSTIDPGVDRYATSNGQRAKVTLSDGTIVSLDVGSQLEVPRNFGETTRHVRLRGRAFFTVTSNAKSPFVVSTSTSTTRVLGTRFMVRQYDSDTSALIAVQDGKVAVGSTVLSAMQQVEVYEGRKLHVVMANSGQFTFAQGVLTLENMPVSSAIVELNRWYATDIRLADPSLSTQRIGGKFVEGSLGDLIEILEWTLNVNVVREGNVLTLYPK
jgi:transmembrane sensor